MFEIIDNFNEKTNAQFEMRTKVFTSKFFENFLKALNPISIILPDGDIVFQSTIDLYWQLIH